MGAEPPGCGGAGGTGDKGSAARKGANACRSASARSGWTGGGGVGSTAAGWLSCGAATVGVGDDGTGGGAGAMAGSVVWASGLLISAPRTAATSASQSKRRLPRPGVSLWPLPDPKLDGVLNTEIYWGAWGSA